MTEISRVNKHKTTHQDGGDDELVLTGILPGVHKITHQDGGDDEIDAVGLAGRCNFVDRGDPSAPDFEDTDFIIDSDWHDLDLSSILPVGTTAALISVYLLDDAAGSYIQFRKNGNVSVYNIAFLKTQVANISLNLDFICFVDSNRKIEYRASTVTFSSVYIVIRGWFV